jgi:hypothetical protein
MSNDDFDLFGSGTPNNQDLATVAMSAENERNGYSAAVYMQIPRTNP